MTKIDTYLEALKLKLVTSAVVSQYTIVKERTTTTDGYLRVQIALSNGDFLELTEYFVHRQRRIETVDYRYQWMDATKRRLIRRWDNTAHHPEVYSRRKRGSGNRGQKIEHQPGVGCAGNAY